MNAQQKSTRKTYRYHWRRFLEFTGLTGNEILESRKRDLEQESYEWEKKILQFKDWLIKKGKSEHTAKTGAAVVRGFFSFHRVALEFRRSESARLGKVQPKYEDYRFSIEDLKKMYDVADLKERYVLTAGKSFGLRAGDFLAITRGDLEPYIDREVPISIGKYQTEKESVPAYPFIDRDAKPVIKLILEKMDREGRTEPNDRVLTYSDTVQLSRVIQRLTERAGIKIGNKRVRFHCMRKFLIDRISSFMSESKWKQIVGKKISEGAYVSPHLLREGYERAISETCFKRAVDESDIEMLAKKHALEALAKNMGISEGELANMFARRRLSLRARTLSLKDEVDVLEEAIEKKRAAEDCPNGDHCMNEQFEEIDERELLSYLRKGWRVTHTLESGRVIVRKT